MHRIKPLWIFPLVLSLILAGCNLPAPTPPPPSPTPGPSPTPTNTPTPSPSPTLPPSPTPIPSARIQAGDHALFIGDYVQARQQYQAVLATSTDTNLRAEALWGLGKTEFVADNYAAVLDPLRTLIQTYSSSAQVPGAYFLLGETYFALQRYQEAAGAYQNYLTLRPGILDDYVQEKRGDAFSALQDYSSALQAYQAAWTASDQTDTSLKIKIAQTYAAGGDPTTALQMYDQISTATTNDYVKAQMDLLSGRALLTLSRPTDAYGRFLDAVNNYPLAYDSYSALVALVNDNQTVDDFNRGLVDYFAGQYGVALAAFERFIAQNPTNDGTAVYYQAKTLYAMGEYQQAVDTWSSFITGYPDNRYWAAAWDDRSSAQWTYLNQYVPAAQELQDFAKQVPSSPFAVTYLMDAARIYERADKLDQAAALWETIGSTYPSDSNSLEAFFQAGITRYRLENYPKALEDFQRTRTLSTQDSDRERALFWVGKAYQAAGDAKDAQAAWQQTQAISTTDYYSTRARDLLNNRPAFAPAPKLNLNYDLGAERKEAASWVRLTFSLPADTDLSTLGALANDPRLVRGTEFWNLGLYDQARLEFEDLRTAVQNNPADTFRLGNYLLDLGAYRSAIFAIRQVLTLAGMDDHSQSMTAPAYFQHVRYGLYYADVIWPTAAQYGFDPLLLMSVVRQESLFEGFVRSTAGARGLMQIVPTTGASIAEQMNWPPDYSDDDLYSPYISLRMGTYYLDANRKMLDGDLYATLAAYNGGPGNASIWQSLAKGDPDLLLEIIRFGETRDYIRGIYETYNIYRSIYSPVQ